MRKWQPIATSVALALMVVAPSSAGAEESIVTVKGDRKQALADRLAVILNSEKAIIGDSGDDAKARQFALDIFGGDTELAELEASAPGITGELIDKLMPIINNSLRVRLPELQRRQSALYAETFDENDLAFLVSFYQSPTGRKLIALTMDNLQTQNMAKSAKQSDDLTISSDAVVADLQSTARAITPQFDEADKTILLGLVRSGVAPKMQAMAKRTQQIGLDWQNEYLPGEEEQIMALMESIVARRLEATE